MHIIKNGTTPEIYLASAAIKESGRSRNLHNKLARHQAGFDMMQTGKFVFRTLEDAGHLACFLANFFPEPGNAVTGLAELMFNAVEHGNLNIGFDRKKTLLENGTFDSEIVQRLQHPQFSSRRAEAGVTRKDDGIYVVITDEGEGFDWKNYLRIDPSRADSSHGRGIAHANTVCFDKLTYNDKGNKVVAFSRQSSSFSW